MNSVRVSLPDLWEDTTPAPVETPTPALEIVREQDPESAREDMLDLLAELSHIEADIEKIKEELKNAKTTYFNVETRVLAIMEQQNAKIIPLPSGENARTETINDRNYDVERLRKIASESKEKHPALAPLWDKAIKPETTYKVAWAPLSKIIETGGELAEEVKSCIVTTTTKKLKLPSPKKTQLGKDPSRILILKEGI
jgi:hypothetical protein